MRNINLCDGKLSGKLLAIIGHNSLHRGQSSNLMKLSSKLYLNVPLTIGINKMYSLPCLMGVELGLYAK